MRIADSMKHSIRWSGRGHGLNALGLNFMWAAYGFKERACVLKGVEWILEARSEDGEWILGHRNGVRQEVEISLVGDRERASLGV